MNTAKLFKNGSSQAVRLPKEYNLEGTEVYVRRIGRSVLLLPKDDPWEDMVKSVHDFTADYLSSRDEPQTQKRDDL
jgi:antitoxin VapB